MARKLCIACNIRAAQTGSGYDVEQSPHGDLCNYCFTEGGFENEHSDNGHDEDNKGAGCWLCHPELNLAKNAPAKGTRKGHHSPRRPQINHKACQHAQTPAARRECRKAYWAGQAVIQQENLEAMAAAHAPMLTAQYSGLVSWDGAKGRVLTGTIVKDLGAGKLQVRTAKGALRQVAFTALRLAS